MNPSERFTELLSLYLDASLTQEQEAELLLLLEQPEPRSRFLELARLDREIAGLLATPIGDEAMVSLVRQDIERSRSEVRGQAQLPPLLLPNAQGWRRLLPPAKVTKRIAALAAVVVVAVGVILWASLENRASAFVPMVKETQGTVHIISSEGRTLASAGKPLLPGQQLVTSGDRSSAVVEYGDASRLELGPDTALSPLRNGGKKLFLSQGSLHVDAVPQPAGEPLIVQTPHAEVVVLGTRFTVESEVEATMVEVAKGSVQFTRSIDRKSIAVGSGNFAVASPAVEKFASQPLTTQAIGRVINVARGIRLNHKGGVSSLAFSPDGKLLASAVWSDGVIRLWPVGRIVSQDSMAMTGHMGAVWSLAFSRDGKTLASGGVDKTVRLWDTQGRKLRTTLDHKDHVRAVAFSLDGSLLATAGFDSSVRIRDPQTGQERSVVRASDRGGWAGVYALAITPDSKSLAVGVSDRTVRLHELTGAMRFSLPGHTDAVRSVAVAPDGKLLASASNNEVFIWDLTTGQQLHRLNGAAPVAFATDGQFLASGGAAPALWQPASGTEQARLQGHRGEVYSLAFSPDGNWLALGGWTGITMVDWPAAIEATRKSAN